jgi:hypothetical protein
MVNQLRHQNDRRRRRCRSAAAGSTGAATAFQPRGVMRVARARLVNVRMQCCMRVHGMAAAMFIAVGGLVMRMRRRRAICERDLMLAAYAMLQRSREHALDGQCNRDDPEQQQSSKFVHVGRYRALEQSAGRAFVQEHIVQRVYSTIR